MNKLCDFGPFFKIVFVMNSSIGMEIYPLNFAKPGIVYIFNNRNVSYASRLDLRAGSEKYVYRLCDTVEELNFNVECYIDKTAKELETYIRS